MLFAGGIAGQAAAVRLASACGDTLVGLVWDDVTGTRPNLPGLSFYQEANCRGVGDTLFCSGFGRILPKDLLASFPRGAFNAHPSLLPNYRGRHAIQWAIAKGERELGVTVHRMSPEIDQGAALLVRRRYFGVAYNCAQISRELAEMAADMLGELCTLLQKPAIPEAPPALPTGPYWPRRRPEDGRLSWQDRGATILDQVRAGTDPYPAYAFLADGTKVAFTKYLASDTPGEVLYISPEGCLIATGDGVIWLVPDRPLARGDILP